MKYEMAAGDDGKLKAVRPATHSGKVVWRPNDFPSVAHVFHADGVAVPKVFGALHR